MYGMLLESIQHFVKEIYGEEVWDKIRLIAGVKNHVFVTHQRYSDDLFHRLAEGAVKVIGKEKGWQKNDFMRFFGTYFVKFFSNYGYDKICRVFGRHVRDFLNGIDSIHEQMRFGYPEMQSPRFYCTEETSTGLTLHYKSKRRGLQHYVIGQIQEVVREFYNMPIIISIISTQQTPSHCHVSYRLKFDNHISKPLAPDLLSPPMEMSKSQKSFSIESFFSIFPFSCVISSDMKLSMAGSSLLSTLGSGILGLRIQDVFILRRPKMDLTWENLQRGRVLFELVSKLPTIPASSSIGICRHPISTTTRFYSKLKTLRNLQTSNCVYSYKRTESRNQTTCVVETNTTSNINRSDERPASCASIASIDKEMVDSHSFKIDGEALNRSKACSNGVKENGVMITKMKTGSKRIANDRKARERKPRRTSLVSRVLDRLHLGCYLSPIIEVFEETNDDAKNQEKETFTCSNDLISRQIKTCCPEAKERISDRLENNDNITKPNKSSLTEDSESWTNKKAKRNECVPKANDYPSCIYGPVRIDETFQQQDGTQNTLDSVIDSVDITVHFSRSIGSKDVIGEDFEVSDNGSLTEKDSNNRCDANKHDWRTVASSACDLPRMAGKEGNVREILEESSNEPPKLHLKGEMRNIDSWDKLLFVCSPVVWDFDEMIRSGMFISDLGMYDRCQEMVFSGIKPLQKLEYARDQLLDRSKKLEESLRKLEEERKRSDELLYSMIPKEIAERLKNGEKAIDTCEHFESVTILFSYLDGFNNLCSKATAMESVGLVNNMFTVFDKLIEKHDVYKFETLGDAVYMAVSGAPVRKVRHAEPMAAMALDMIDSMHQIKDVCSNDSLTITIGMYSGAVVAGLVGQKMPQYCLFGHTVNIASRLRTTSLPMRIHVGDSCNDCLKNTEFQTEFRGTILLKPNRKHFNENTMMWRVDVQHLLMVFKAR